MVFYRDGDGDRAQETFERKRDADARQAEIKTAMRAGTHVATSKSPTVAQAGQNWIRAAEAHGLERSTIKQYREHLNLHIVPLIGATRLADISAAAVRRFQDRLGASGRSPAMIRKIVRSLGTLLADAQERGLVGKNAVRDLSRRRTTRQQETKLEVGKHIPTPQEILRILSHAQSRWRPLIYTAVFTGLRASELRGLRWSDVDFKAGELRVRQRADRFNAIGKPKSSAGTRKVPFGKVLATVLKEWKLACPKGELDLVFPSGAGKIEGLANIRTRGLIPTQIAAGVVDRSGQAKYPGIHALRHFYASWCINRLEDGGLELPPKVVQERLGHAKIGITLDTYGHLFPRGDDAAQIDAAELRLIRGER